MRCGMWVLALLLSIQQVAAEDAVWWEAESAVQHNFPKAGGLAARNLERRDLLSGNDWLSVSGQRHRAEAPVFAKYRVAAPAGGTYEFWTRKFWKHGPFRWRFDQGEWSTCGPDAALADVTPIQKFVEANWVHLGAVTLEQGNHTLEIQLIADEGAAITAAFDCFVLTTGSFSPRGKLKPGDKSGQADDGFFPYEPSVDPFTDDALLDLRSLNEPVAGQSGFLKREGNQIVLGDGTPVRFWAMNVSRENAGQGRASVDYMARRLAKAGVNMVRFHSSLLDGVDPNLDLSDKHLDDLFYLVAAMKRNGIYTKLSFYFPLWLQMPQGYESIDNKHPFGLLYFDPATQQRYRAWARKLLDTPNPHTGLTLAQDPAVGMVEIVNEDSLFFWTFGPKNIPPAHWQALEQRFGQWLGQKYGSVEKAFDAWDGAELASDDAAAARAGLFDAWHMTRDGLRQGGSAKRRRIADQVEFLARLQRAFYADTVAYFRNDLHVGGLITTSNWKVADGSLLSAIERWTYTAGDVIDRHGYFGGSHKGDGAAWSVRAGHRYEDQAAVRSPEALPIQFQQVADYPQIITELGWTNPNRYRADATLLCSAYGALQGVDGLFFFAMGSNSFSDTAMHKFAAASPVIAATFPAAALQYRRGDVQVAEPAVFQALKLNDLFQLEGSAVADAEALDELRKKDLPPTAVIPGDVGGFDPKAFYVGPVIEEIDGNGGASWQRDLRAYVDPGRKTIRSVTNQLRWDYGQGVVRVDTPASQAAAGFLSTAGTIQLQNVAIDSRNEFGSIMVIALDDKPIAQSARLLIQAMTEERPLGFKTKDGVIEAVGSAPFGVREIDATISLDVEEFASANITALDENGYARPDGTLAPPPPPGKTIPLQLRPDTIHYLLTVQR